MLMLSHRGIGLPHLMLLIELRNNSRLRECSLSRRSSNELTIAITEVGCKGGKAVVPLIVLLS